MIAYRRWGVQWWTPFAFSLLVVVSCKGKEKSEMDAGVDTDEESPCPWDDDGDHTKASVLTLGSPAQGYLCPEMRPR